jgi:hypothetical protein
MLSTSKIIPTSSCTALGSLDLVPGFTVSFLTASSSFRKEIRDPDQQPALRGQEQVTRT